MSTRFDETSRKPPSADHGLFISSGGESVLAEGFEVGQPGILAEPNIEAQPLPPLGAAGVPRWLVRRPNARHWQGAWHLERDEVPLK